MRLDLAQTMDLGESVGFSVGYGGVALNAAMTVAFGYDYRAAAEVRTTIHAESADNTTFKTLLDRAKEFDDDALTLPAGAEVDQNVVDKSHAIVKKLTGIELTKPQMPAETG